jgi:hypothetical protein
MYSGSIQQVNERIAKIFKSRNQEWIVAISMTVELMYEQFVRDTAEAQGRQHSSPALEDQAVRGIARAAGSDA